MVSQTQLAAVIQHGHDITSVKLHAVSMTALLFYDYFLTLKDEVRYAWKTESTLIFVLFLFTRYLPMAFETWLLITFFYPEYTSEMYVCRKSAWAEIMYYTLIGTSAQIVLAQRTYAITKKNKWVAAILYTICAVQFSAGVYEFIWSALSTTNISPIPLDTYRLCLPTIERKSSLVQMVLSLAFDLTVFFIVLTQTRIIRSTHQMSGSRILDTVSRDAEIYFAVITTSHILIVVMILAGRPGTRAIPILGNAVLIPLMICRMIMSLKKAAGAQPTHTSVDFRTGLPIDTQDIHSHRPMDTIQLSVFRK